MIADIDLLTLSLLFAIYLMFFGIATRFDEPTLYVVSGIAGLFLAVESFTLTAHIEIGILFGAMAVLVILKGIRETLS
jgi:hypothetical protein